MVEAAGTLAEDGFALAVRYVRWTGADPRATLPPTKPRRWDMGSSGLQHWDVWYPKAAAAGVLIARGAVDATDSLLVHAAGDVVTVEVSDADGRRVACGQDLRRTLQSPMCRLSVEGERVGREDLWPTEADLGSVVLLPGGEAGRLLRWWHAADHGEWRWQVEFYNRLG